MGAKFIWLYLLWTIRSWKPETTFSIAFKYKRKWQKSQKLYWILLDIVTTFFRAHRQRNSFHFIFFVPKTFIVIHLPFNNTNTMTPMERQPAAQLFIGGNFYFYVPPNGHGPNQFVPFLRSSISRPRICPMVTGGQAPRQPRQNAQNGFGLCQKAVPQADLQKFYANPWPRDSHWKNGPNNEHFQQESVYYFQTKQ